VSPSYAQALNHEDLDWVTLITCRDFDETSNTYLNRIVVKAVLVSIVAE